jgi:hypothetical protein
MTAKEKAKELIHKFKNNTRAFNETNGWEDTLHDAKQCALIAVDEILDLIEDDGFTFAEYHDKKTIKFWLEVKNEIKII